MRVNSKFPLNLGDVLLAIAKIMDDHEKWTSWVGFAVKLPFEIIKTITAHQTLINTHSLLSSEDFPGAEKARSSIHQLFNVR